MRALGCDRRLITVDEALAIEPALRHIAPKLAGATYTAQDESGDANRFARELVEHCQADGVRFLMSHTVTALRAAAGKLEHVEATDAEGRFQFLQADAYVLAMGSWSPLYVRPLGIRLPIYPAKGYSVTMPVRDATRAFQVSLTDDEHKIVFSRLGDKLRIAGTAELNGYDRDLNRVRCEAIVRRTEELFPGAGDTGARAVLDGPAARDAVERADHRPLEAAEPVPEHGPRHARLDARVRLRQEHRAHRQRAEAGGRVPVRRRVTAARSILGRHEITGFNGSCSAPCCSLHRPALRSRPAGFSPLFDGTLGDATIENGGAFTIENSVLRGRRPRGLAAVPGATSRLPATRGAAFSHRQRRQRRVLARAARRRVRARLAESQLSGAALESAGWASLPPIGGVFRHGMPPGETALDREAVSRAFTGTGEWQLLEIELVGTELAVQLNGVPVTKASGIADVAGYIGIQSETRAVEFRRIDIEVIDSRG